MRSKALLVVPNHRAKDRANIQISRIVKTAFDSFEIDRKKWTVRFQSWPRKSNEPDALLELTDDYPDDGIHRDAADGVVGVSLPEKLAWLVHRQAQRETQTQDKTGWHLRRNEYVAEGWFDLTKLPLNAAAKKPFCSFDYVQEGTVYRCQLHIWESSSSRNAPTAWDNRRGASAGIPTLGKRR
jgi:hypothetical protein